MRRLLAKRAAQLDRIERLDARTVRSFAKQIEQAALDGVHGGSVQINTGPILDELVELMLLAYLKRYQFERRELNLSFTREVKKLARQLELDDGVLRRSFRRRTQPALERQVGSIADRVNKELQRITARQLSTRQSVRELRRGLTRMGLTPRNAGTIETLTRTHSMIAANAAQWQLDREADTAGIITGYMYSAVMDERTEDTCAALDGSVFAINDPALQRCWPPNHYNCRCQMIPLTDPVDADGAPADLIDAAVHEDFDFNPGELLSET